MHSFTFDSWSDICEMQPEANRNDYKYKQIEYKSKLTQIYIIKFSFILQSIPFICSWIMPSKIIVP